MKKLKLARLRADMKQIDVCIEVRIDQCRMSLAENGKLRLKDEELKKLGKLYGYEFWELLGEEDI